MFSIRQYTSAEGLCGLAHGRAERRSRQIALSVISVILWGSHMRASDKSCGEVR